MRRFFPLAAMLFAGLTALAQPTQLDGFAYDERATAPTGDEWQSPEALALNKEQPRAWGFHFSTEAAARGVMPERGAYWQSLDGTWKFHWCATPEERPQSFFERSFDVSKWDNIAVPGCWNVQGIQKDGSMKYGSMKYGVPIYVNQKVIFEHQVAVGDWKGGVMREPRNKQWTTMKYRNEVGSYRRTFTVPAAWKGRRIFINFDGVDSFFYLWINGRYVGFSKNSRNTASFDITRFIDAKAAEQVVAVEVYRNSDGSFLEAQDMFRLPGIIRSTYLTSVPEVTLSDLVVRTTSLSGDRAVLDIQTEIRQYGKKLQTGLKTEFRYYPVRLYTDDIEGSGQSIVSGQEVKGIRPWSAEAPYRYVLTATLKDKKGKVLDVRSTFFGFRTVEIRETAASDDEFRLAGRYYYVNGKTVKLKGVNRHETNPWTGHAITHEQIEKEIYLMKQGNINHVRNSHYANDPYWYYACDKYGIYLEDEANIESHEYYYGDASLSHPKEWQAAHIARNMEMVRAHVNAPCIVIWSLGNEAGPGDNFKAAYAAIKAFDTSRPVQYERNNNIVDMGSNQYPSADWVKAVAKGTAQVKYPFHISEYAHSMGNACGGLADIWEGVESSNFFCGGAIWDWVDQAIDTYKADDGTKYFGYGGDHGDWPNDGMFCMNGIMLPDLTPKPQYWEVKHVYQDVGVMLKDAQSGTLEIQNKRYFTDLSDVEARYRILRDGMTEEQGTLDLPKAAPRQRVSVRLPYDFTQLDPTSTWTAVIEFCLKADRPWAKKGYVQMSSEVIILDRPLDVAATYAVAVPLPAKPVLKKKEAKREAELFASLAAQQRLVFKGERFTITFDNTQGCIFDYTYDGKTLIANGGGPRLNALRAPVDNDNWFCRSWFQNGLHNLQHGATLTDFRVMEDGRTIIAYTVVSQGKYVGELHGGSSGRYTVKDVRPMTEDDFAFTTNQVYTIHPDGAVQLESYITASNPTATLPRLGYLLRLPAELDQLSYFGRGPQNNYSDRQSGAFLGLYVTTVADQFVAFPKPQEMANREDVRFLSLTNKADQGLFFASTHEPISTSALPWNDLELTYAPHIAELPKPSATWLHLDTGSTGLGGTSCGQAPPPRHQRVIAADHVMGFIIAPLNVALAGHEGFCPQPVERKPDGSVKVTVLSASSEEPGCGADLLIDKDPNSFWHTAYGVTVTKYPHTIDFDCGEQKNIQGFTYLPRQDGSTNGNIKGYRVQLSQDAQTWSEPVAEGNFDNNTNNHRVRFNKPQRARYLRFTALSSQNGQDFASGAEFTVLAE